VLLRTEPDTFATLTDLGARVTFFFDERISETVAGGDLNDAVTVSPQTGNVRVRHGRTSLSVDVEGGFRPGLVYRVTLQPVIRDMFGNQLRDPFELVLSTGGQAPPTAIAGQVWSRVNGGSTRGALVQAIGADSVVYVARSDEAGIYSFRYLPEGDYRITAFEDVDRDGVLDAREPQGTVSSTLASGDTLLVDVPTLPNDTTPAVAAGATALDSVTIVLELDDYLDPDVPASAVTATLAREDGSAPNVVRLLHEREYAAYIVQVADSLARLDSIDAAQASPPAPAPDTSTAAAAPDSSGVAAPAGTAPAGANPQSRPGRPTPPPLPGSVTDGGGPRPRPVRRIVALLDAPLAVEIEYQVQVGGVVNINGLPGGGGEVALMLRPPALPPPPTAGPGGAATPGDAPAPGVGGAGAAPVDTLGVAR